MMGLCSFVLGYLCYDGFVPWLKSKWMASCGGIFQRELVGVLSRCSLLFVLDALGSCRDFQIELSIILLRSLVL